MDIVKVVEELRREGGDDEAVEAKAAHGGFPARIPEVICAFANRPEGGVIIFGLDESANFKSVGVYNAAECKQSLTNIARTAVTPTVSVATETVAFEGRDLVVTYVHEAAATAKPVKLVRTGQAYLRQYDGNYPLSELEEQAFIANRSQPTFDTLPVAEADAARDLDSSLVENYLQTRKLASPSLTRLSDEEVLVRTGVLTPDQQVSVAGILALGIYPQQFFPTCVVQASIAPQTPDSLHTRAEDLKIFDGPLPAILDAAGMWVAHNTRTRIVVDADGAGRDEPTYPPTVVRELLANALIHRDLSSYGLSMMVTLKLTPQSLIISNPGGLFGLSVETLGATPSHSRNHRLADIATYIRTRNGRRIIERLGTGIPAVRESLREAELPPPLFYDSGLRFTAKVMTAPEQQNVTPEVESTGLGLGDLSPNSQAIISTLKSHSLTRNEISEATGLGSRQVSYALAKLKDAGIIASMGKPGSPYTRYRLAESPHEHQ